MMLMPSAFVWKQPRQCDRFCPRPWFDADLKRAVVFDRLVLLLLCVCVFGSVCVCRCTVTERRCTSDIASLFEPFQRAVKDLECSRRMFLALL